MPEVRERAPKAASVPHTAEAAVPLLTELPKAQRDALVLVAVRGHSYVKAAELLDVPSAGTVKSRVHRARATLFELLASGTLADSQKIESWAGPYHLELSPDVKTELECAYAHLFAITEGEWRPDAKICTEILNAVFRKPRPLPVRRLPYSIRAPKEVE